MKLKKYLTFLIFMTFSVIYSQTKNIVTGSVKDINGIPLLGATVVIENSNKGTMTDDQGLFTIHAIEGEILTVSYVFYETKSIHVGANLHYDIVLHQVSETLNDIVVVAYGTSTKESITGALSYVTSSDIEKRPNTNVLNALTGAAPGVRVNNSSGQPGAEPSIRIRGFTSMDKNDPLIVLDGMVYAGRVGDINPIDVESITVLKDASATTLYGNRASNGVILINTKKASKRDGFFGVSFKQGLVSRFLKEYDKVEPDQFMETMWMGYRNSLVSNGNSIEEAGRLATANLIPEILGMNIYNLSSDQLFDTNGRLVPHASVLKGYRSDLDWYKPIERTGTYQDLNLNGRMSNEKGGAYFSTGFLNNEGYFRGSDYKRFTTRVNADYMISDIIKIGTNVSGSHQITNLNSVSPESHASSIAPIYPIHLHDSKTGDYIYDELGDKIYDLGENTRKQYERRHMILENQLNSMERIATTLNSQIYTDIKLMKDLTFSLKANLALNYTDVKEYQNSIVGSGANLKGRSYRNNNRGKTYSFQQLLNWKKDIGQHNIDVLFGHENLNVDSGNLNASKIEEIFTGIVDWSNFNKLYTANDFLTKYRTEGYFSRAKYNYANKYFLEASFRRDGSSKFHSDTRWGNFWSAGGSWIISSEDFFKIKQIDYLKLRASYGEVGDDSAAGLYAYYSLYRSVSNAGQPAVYRKQFGNKGLKWETSSSTNFAIDGRVFNRLNFTVEYFDKRSKNLLFNLEMPLSNGSTAPTFPSSSIVSNVGSISNRGFEFSFDVDIIKKSDWSWNVGVNATMLKNKLLKLPSDNRENGIVSIPFLRKEGRSVYEFYLTDFVGVDQMTGNALYTVDSEKYNVNGSAPDKPSVSDEYLVNINGQYYTTNPDTFGKKVYAGSAIPKVDGSFSTSLHYKSLNLSGLFTYALGGKVLDYNYMSLMEASDMVRAIHKDITHSWSSAPNGMTETSPDRINPNGIPQINYTTSQYNNVESNRFIRSGDFLSIQNIALNYDFPSELLKKIKVKQMSMNISVENVYTFTKFKGLDPQQSFSGAVGSGAGAPRIFIFGINFNF
ncbi:SusC/RagA family TonB-linked outer membrane protein [Myroides odoratimimus]|uniref:SusC/RagA family TonB-linked outer membrane protein n=1 Tax=Myroides odoratimimus CCUG 10230 TaxID=883150 RepID=A0ABP2NCJ1_9FLAO|nr:SusC/RagA family TonB-linked outer membrane protein [Myroides odoratimimus]EHO09367.1 SusC/RagA family TonB-linked outer membrane protein [Myroides odoratimimus CCUG 10230]MDM1085911.1 SusC/RagA family TonB-linked outer membrane protein [Myroides odoratimimus]MDM1457851.1 SusC/RagA family TonB-linked outer membrane protein [Myroides odoratimimus]MEC4086103.1 SusC/RagA family TonB-linked outer membrane protein [Myroides odoratimimus]STZ49562.1 Outer membrane receptor for ferrienterochelin an